MERERKVEKGSALIRSLILLVIGMAFIPLGLSFLPGIGIAIGALLMVWALYPWLNTFHLKKVNIITSVVTDNYLDSKKIAVAILSAAKERDGFDFDPRRIDPSSAHFGPLKARPVDDMSDPGVYIRSFVDVNEDGIPDMVLYFSGDDAGVTAYTREACFRAKTWDGERIYGCNMLEFEYPSKLIEKLEYA